LSFVDDDQYFEGEVVSEVTRRRLELMISIALLTPDEKLKYEDRAIFITEDEAQKVMQELVEYMPIMGLHLWPLDVKQQGQAIRYQVMKDDFHEQRWKK
jgi:hypothetical protein